MKEEERDVFGELNVVFHTKLKTDSGCLALQEYSLLRVGEKGFIPIFNYHGELIAKLEVLDHEVKVVENEGC